MSSSASQQSDLSPALRALRLILPVLVMAPPSSWNSPACPAPAAGAVGEVCQLPPYLWQTQMSQNNSAPHVGLPWGQPCPCSSEAHRHLQLGLTHLLLPWSSKQAASQYQQTPRKCARNILWFHNGNTGPTRQAWPTWPVKIKDSGNVVSLVLNTHIRSHKPAGSRKQGWLSLLPSFLGKTVNDPRLCSAHMVTDVNTECLELHPWRFPPTPSSALLLNCESSCSFILAFLVFPFQF